MQPGDILTHVDDKAVTADTSTALYLLISSRPHGSDDLDRHRFTVLRDAKKEPVQITVTRKDYSLESVFGVRRREDNSWDYWLDSTRKIAYLRIGFIDREAPMQLRTALSQLGDAKGLILDLRWCPGGFLTQSAEIAGIFLETGTIASVKYRHPEELGQKEYRADNFGLDRFRYKDVPALVLVNGETMGGGELIAAALQDNGRAKVAGQRTFGKGSVQTPMELIGFDNIVLRLSAGTIVRPSGKNLQRFANSKRNEDWGVRPDMGFEIPSSESLSRRLKEWHQAYVLRPPEGHDALPLDDPENDAPRILAMKLLQRNLPSK
jgi:carboxyl-terminal processing protease